MENWYPSRGLAGRGLGETEGFGLSSEASALALGESENLPRPRGRPLALIFARLKQYFRFLLRVPLLVVSDTKYAACSTSVNLRNPSLRSNTNCNHTTRAFASDQPTHDAISGVAEAYRSQVPTL